MRTIDPSQTEPSEIHRYLLACVAPRPIAFVGTVDADNRPNLAPFSFFNAFGANPPVVAFSPAHRGTDGSVKHSYVNIQQTEEFTVSVVNYDMVEQMSLASADWPDDVDEFEKSGFTKQPSSLIAPPGVAESPMVMECKLIQHVPLGGKPSSGNLMIGEVVMLHLKDSLFEGKYPEIDRLDLVARMGGPYYCRASGDAVFELPKPKTLGIGFDGLPSEVKQSPILTGNDLARLAGIETLPDSDATDEFWKSMANVQEPPVDDVETEMRGSDSDRVARAFVREYAPLGDSEQGRRLRHSVARWFAARRELERAWHVLRPGNINTA